MWLMNSGGDKKFRTLQPRHESGGNCEIIKDKYSGLVLENDNFNITILGR